MDRPPLPLPWETARLLLRAPTVADAPLIQEAIEESFQDLHDWMPWAASLQTIDETRAYVERTEARLRSGEEFAVSAFLKQNGRFVLGSGLHSRKTNVPSFEIGYWCRSSMQRQGYTHETVLALTELAFQHLAAERIEIRCDSRNARSRRVAERAGYRLEAVLRSDDRANDGSLRDTAVYALLRAETPRGR